LDLSQTFEIQKNKIRINCKPTRVYDTSIGNRQRE